MSLVAVLDVLIVVLLGALVVLEILRPRRIRHLMAEVDRRTEEITTALDAAQERMERTLSEFAGAEAADERSRSGPVGGDGDRRREEPAGEEIELDAAVDAGPEPQARELREKIARLLEDAGRERSERERRLLHQLQETLERPPGADRFEQEKALYSALEAAAGESGPRTPTESPEEERELIAKLRREARR